MCRNFVIFVLVCVANGKYYKTADVAIVVDTGPMYEQHVPVDPSSPQARLTCIYDIIRALIDLTAVDVRVGLFTHSISGTTTVLPFKDGVKGADIMSKIRDPLINLQYKRYDHSNFEAIVRGVRDGAIKNCDGNRPPSPDLVIWTMIHESSELHKSENYLRNVLFAPADDVMDIAINLISWGGILYHIHQFTRLGNVKNPHFDCYEVGDKNTLCLHKIAEMPGTVANGIRGLLDYCAEPTGTPAGPCSFNYVYRCTVPITYVPQDNIDPRFRRYCPNGRIDDADCPQGDAKCCEDEEDKEYVPCNVPCDGQGQQMSRPRNPALHQKCNYTSKPCTGPPCPTTRTTTTTTPKSTTTTTTTRSTSRSTSTAPRTTRTTRKHTPPRLPGQPTPYEPPEPESITTTPGGDVVPTVVTSATPGLQSWQIVLIGIGSLLLLALLILLILWVTLRKRKKRRQRMPPRDYRRSPSHQRPDSPRHHRPSRHRKRTPPGLRSAMPATSRSPSNRAANQRRYRQ